jgi:hypothetical protein
MLSWPSYLCDHRSTREVLNVAYLIFISSDLAVSHPKMPSSALPTREKQTNPEIARHPTILQLQLVDLLRRRVIVEWEIK